MKKNAIHTPLNFFKAGGSQLLVHQIPLRQVIARAGQTPVYIYDRQLMSERVQLLRDVLPSEIQLHYAMKANPMPAVVQHMATLVDGLDVASHGEMLVALDSGMPAHEISFAGPGKTDKELTAAVAAQITINVESETELRRIQQLGEALSLKPQVAIRINPDFELKASGMKMAGGPKQFGIDAESVPELLKTIPDSINLVGFHIFCGSQNLVADSIIDAHNKTFELAGQLVALSPDSVRSINIGGGFGIPYFPGDTPLDLNPIGKNLERLLEQYRKSVEGCSFVIELGRFLVGEAGIYVCEVVDRKVSRGQTYLVTNGGLHHHLSNSGNFGQVLRKNYPVVIGNRMDVEEKEVVNVVGPLCTPLDIVANKMELPKAEIGDLVTVLQSGAYGYSASPHRFLSHPDVVEVLV